MRVIAGIYRSRILKSLKGLALRPTSDRLRETLLNVLAPNLPGSRFVDLFAGTGAIGIEALSRGAAEVVFIENQAPAVTLIRRNLESLRINSRALEFLASADLLAPGGIVIAEHRRNFDLSEEPGALRRFRVLRQGDAALSFYRRRGEASGETSGKNNSAE